MKSAIASEKIDLIYDRAKQLCDVQPDMHMSYAPGLAITRTTVSWPPVTVPSRIGRSRIVDVSTTLSVHHRTGDVHAAVVVLDNGEMKPMKSGLRGADLRNAVRERLGECGLGADHSNSVIRFFDSLIK